MEFDSLNIACILPYALHILKNSFSSWIIALIIPKNRHSAWLFALRQYIVITYKMVKGAEHSRTQLYTRCNFKHKHEEEAFSKTYFG